MNRYPDSTDSDDWGVSPNAGYEMPMTEEELEQYQKDRSARDALNNEATPKADFHDRQLEKALAWVKARLEKQLDGP
jgi:carboxyl-terminal processing protease